MEKPKVIIELYLASPPTFKCREMIKIAEEVSKEFPDKVIIRIYYKGQPIPEDSSPGFRASLKSIGIPTIFIDGIWIASTNPPNYEKVKNIVEEHIKMIDDYFEKSGS
ncbi:MAG: hypothetical protein N3D74_05475 [Caldisericia bacterium]|nr:hypothetical protein [Caldisericia bacterium]